MNSIAFVYPFGLTSIVYLHFSVENRCACVDKNPYTWYNNSIKINLPDRIGR